MSWVTPPPKEKKNNDEEEDKPKGRVTNHTEVGFLCFFFSKKFRPK
jgi:hypothetical protein